MSPAQWTYAEKLAKTDPRFAKAIKQANILSFRISELDREKQRAVSQIEDIEHGMLYELPAEALHI